ncbi:hypothetical protein [Nocardia pseudovaccinii]|uniref:hypothetical protein n=1 Tax=Nocardia pseudovaccinii TaxID=189540 RepID=UPI0007A3BFEB|nr:hypothetical protein [Nocardia pseudovaccinii]
MSYLRAFAPWIVFAVVPSQYWQWAALAALGVSVLGIAQQVRAGQRPEAMAIDIGSVVFFAALTVVAFAAPDSAMHPYTPALSSGVLAVVAGVSLAVRMPFTLSIAKQTTPQELWDHPVFVRTAYVITSVWTASFVIGCIALTALVHSASGVRTIVQVLAFVLPVLFTIRYVAYIRAKANSLDPSAS